MSEAKRKLLSASADGKPFGRQIKAEKYEAYLITCSTNNKSYVGITTKGIEVRWKRHLYDALRKNSRNILHRAIRKYGVESFSILCIGTSDSWVGICRIEKRLIEELGTFSPYGYNATLGGEGAHGHRFTEDGKANHAAAIKISTASPEWRANVAAAAKKRAEDPVWLAANAEIVRHTTSTAEWKEKQRAGCAERPLNSAWYVNMRPAWDAVALRYEREAAEKNVADPAGAEKRRKQREADKRCAAKSLTRMSRTERAAERVAASDKADPGRSEIRAYHRAAAARHRARRAGQDATIRRGAIDITERDVADPDGAEARRLWRERDARQKSRKAGVATPTLHEMNILARDAADPAGAAQRALLREKSKAKYKARTERRRTDGQAPPQTPNVTPSDN